MMQKMTDREALCSSGLMHTCLLAGAEREALGRCIAGLVLRPAPDAATCKPGCHLYTFAKALGSGTSQSASLEDLGFAEGDMVVLSVEGALPCSAPMHRLSSCAARSRCHSTHSCPFQCCSTRVFLHAGRHAALARGHMHSVAADAVTVALGKPLRPSLLADVRRGPCACWRIDRDEVASISVRLRRSVMGALDPAACALLCAGACCTLLHSLHSPRCCIPCTLHHPHRVCGCAGLFVRGDPQARKLRRLVVDLQPPAVVCTGRPGMDAPELNPEQLLAVNRCAALRSHAQTRCTLVELLRAAAVRKATRNALESPTHTHACRMGARAQTECGFTAGCWQ